MPLHAQQPPWMRPALPPPVVLLVENHADSRALYAFDLRHFGFRVHEAGTTTEAIQAAAALRPSIVVADLTLRDPSELELCQALKESAATSNVPIIALTANATIEAKHTAEQAGCAAVLVKPCVPSVLRAEIERLLADTLARVRSEFIEMPGLHLTVSQAARLLGLDPTTAAQLLDRLVAEGFLRRTGSQMYLRSG